MNSIADTISGFILRQSNRLGRIRDAIYLDANAWSTLAKQEVPYEPLRDWAREQGYYIWMARFQLAELTGDTRLAHPLADLLRGLPVVLLNEFQGEPWYKVRAELELPLRLSSDELVVEFVDQMTNGPIRETRKQLAKDSDVFRDSLTEWISSIPESAPRNWSSFPRRLESWIRFQCERNGVEISEKSLADPQCYVGLRLSCAVLFARYFIARKQWEPSDYIDYLHAADMAYAGSVITERGLAECIRQAARRKKDLIAPHTVMDLSGLKVLRAANQGLPADA